MTQWIKTNFWYVILAITILLLWLFKSILLPFVLAGIFAYFLNPLVCKLEQHKFSRTSSSLIVFSAFSLLIILSLLILLPIIINQLIDLAQYLPKLLNAIYEPLQTVIHKVIANLSSDDMQKIQASVLSSFKNIAQVSGTIVTALISNSLAAINLMALIAITPLATFYFLRDWPKITGKMKSWIPSHNKAKVTKIFSDIDYVLMGYVLGIMIVGITLALFYGISLSIIGLNFGFTIGVIAGLISFIPYVGTAVGLAASLGVAFYQFWPNWIMITIVLAIFMIGQILSDYLLVPRLVGDRIGLHPMWVVFGLLAGGSLMGFVGLLIAVPISAIIGVLVRFSLKQYKHSDLYV